MVGCLNLLPPQSHAGNIAERIPRYRPGFAVRKKQDHVETHRDTINVIFVVLVQKLERR